MAIFRISFDVGAGWVVYTPYKNNLTWTKGQDINPAINRVVLSGDVVFSGSEYTALLAFKDAGNNYVPILVEQDNTGWNTIFEGNADLLMSWDENRSIITLNKFNNGADVYDNLLSNYTTKYGINTFSLTGHVINTPAITTSTQDAVSVITALTPANYILQYDINGFLNIIPGLADPRWVYFLFRSTNGDGSHNFETMSFDLAPDISAGYNEIRLLVSGVYTALWVKLPPLVAATETLSTPVAYNFHRFPDVMGALLTIAVSTLTFTEATALTYAGLFDGTPTQYAWFDYTLYQIGEAAEISGAGFKNSEISLKDCFDIMEAFALYWYLDGVALKFLHQSELGTSGTLDLSAQTANLQRLDYIEANEIPDAETWSLNDSQGVALDTGTSDIWGEFQIYYRASNIILSNTRKNLYNINLSTNVPALMAGLANTDKNNFALVETVDNTTVPRTIYGATNPIMNNRLTAGGFFSNQVKYRYGTSPNLATRLKIGLVAFNEFETRPLLKIPVTNYHIDLLTNYDMDKAITTSAGTGKTKQISQHLNTDYAELEIEI